MKLKPGDYVKWDIPNAGEYPDRYGPDRLMVVDSVDKEYACVKYENTGMRLIDSNAFYHHRFKVIPKFLILAEQAIKSKEKHGTKSRNRSKQK